MFSPKPKSIIVVYPKEYYKIATYLKHNISLNENFDSTLYTIEHYKQNLPALSGKSYVVFLGTEKECPVAEPFHSFIEEITFYKGACFGMTGTKSIVFGLDSQTVKKFIDNKPEKKYVDLDGKSISFSNNGKLSKLGFISSNSIIKASLRNPLFLTSAIIGGVGISAAGQITDRAKDMWNASEQRMENIEIACNLFIEYGLSKWAES
ncbi:hypothetical protein WNY79_10880 [Pseudoalteromonas sp. AS84]|uniref:hypothetical protein n=1 Tax=Pseudoalteromonas sp. AS84 TaxID=3135778 RepID=UPI0031822E2F